MEGENEENNKTPHIIESHAGFILLDLIDPMAGVVSDAAYRVERAPDSRRPIAQIAAKRRSDNRGVFVHLAQPRSVMPQLIQILTEKRLNRARTGRRHRPPHPQTGPARARKADRASRHNNLSTLFVPFLSPLGQTGFLWASPADPYRICGVKRRRHRRQI
jgi:hypothetical protein